MAMVVPLHLSCKTTPSWRTNNSNEIKAHLYKTLAIPKPSQPPTPPLVILSSSTDPSSHSLLNPHKNSSKEKALFFETLHQNQSLKRALLEKLNDTDSDPLQILKDDEDWSNEHFWVVIRFLKQTSRSKEILPVFHLWKKKENSRNNELNYEKIIVLLVEDGLTEEAVSALLEMKSHGLKPSLEIYNSLIHGFAGKGRFEDALFYLKEMEDIDLKPDTETYDGLIQAYGNYRMYDEMGECVKKMESNGCLPDHITYNLLIQAFSRAGLVKRMERTHRIIISKRMDLHSSSLVAMLEAYANFGILDKMEEVYRRVLNSRTPLKEDLVRKLASVYIDNYMFSRLDDLALDLCSKNGRTNLVWCLRVLSRACILSRKGMNSVVREMELERVPWNVTVANIILLAYLKMKDFRNLNIILSGLQDKCVKPDIVTVGILFDASRFGFNRTWAINTCRRMGFLDGSVEMNTDALVFTAFGKGYFLRSCEEMYSSLEPESRKREVWKYRHLIDSVIKHDNGEKIFNTHGILNNSCKIT